MPNIELHGFSATQAKNIIQRIDNMSRNEPWEKEYVITNHVQSTVTDCDNNSQPFIRLVSTEKSAGIDDLITKLARLGFDLEIMFLHSFIPKE